MQDVETGAIAREVQDDDGRRIVNNAQDLAYQIRNNEVACLAAGYLDREFRVDGVGPGKEAAGAGICIHDQRNDSQRSHRGPAVSTRGKDPKIIFSGRKIGDGK